MTFADGVFGVDLRSRHVVTNIPRDKAVEPRETDMHCQLLTPRGTWFKLQEKRQEETDAELPQESAETVVVDHDESSNTWIFVRVLTHNASAETAT